MWRCVRSLVPLLVVFGICHGMLIIGPNKFRSNRKYTLVVSNFNDKNVDLLVTMQGTSESNGKNVLNLKRSVDVRQHTNKLVDFHIPDNLPRGSYKLTFQGQRGLSYLEEVPLSFEWKSIFGFIQINKPVFKPGDTVLFRVVVLNIELKPPVNVNTVNVVITDPHGNVIRRWSAGRLHVGVFENKLEISPAPLQGEWTITVHADGEDMLVSKQFVVKEYVLSTFDVEVYPSTIPLMVHQGLDLVVSANYFFGKPVKGTAILELYLEDDVLDQSTSWEIHGKGHTKLNFNQPLLFEEKQQSVRVNLTFIEQFTNRTVTKQHDILVYKDKYDVELVTDSQQFRPETSFKCEIRLKYHDGKPAKNVAVQLTIEGLDEDLDENLISDRNGIIRKTLRPSSSTTNINIMAAVEGNELLNEEIAKNEIGTDAYVKVELKSVAKLKKLLRLSVKCSQKMSFLVYYVVSKGEVIDTGYIKTSNIKTHQLQIMATANMVPKSRIILATLSHQTVIYDIVDLVFDSMINDVYIPNKEVKPGTEINLDVRGQPGSYVALAAYDRSLLQHNTNHDVLWEDIVELFNRFHLISDSEYDPIHGMGLFARTMDNVQVEVSGQFHRTGWQSNHAKTEKLVAYRTNFLESWLWQNVTMAASGRLNLSEIAPDTTTSWYVTGFAIHPVHGMGIIKKPIQITTVQPFYIVENLPYSIKRGEEVALQFTLFNNLDRDYTATVTMYNVANQTEFIGCPGELSCTMSVSVPEQAGKPISFLVKSRKLGEMVVRVKATITHEMADAIDKVIRVMPDSLVQKDMESRFFSFNSYKNETFKLSFTNIDKRANPGSTKIIFSLYPNLLTPVGENLENLLSVPTGSGEGNMIHFVPIVAVLDYLTARDLKNEQMINKATTLLRQGYQNQMKYRQTDGSFGVWQNKGGSVFLTAFVANALQSAAKYIPEVDITMVAKAFQWLAEKQNSSGHFAEVGSIIHYDLQGGVRNGIALTSYVLIAFMENDNAREAHGSVITKGIQYVESSLRKVTDSYDISIATYALALNNRATQDAFDKLIEKSTGVGGGVERFWSRESHSVETTAYALLALVQAGRYIDGIPIMRWLVNQRYVTGSFPRTQDTFVGLKALAKLSEIITPARNDYTIQLRNTRTKQLKTYHISSENDRTLTVGIDSDTRVLEVNVAGQGFGAFDVRYEYTVDMQNSNHRFNLTVKQFTYNSNFELKLKVCASFIPQLLTEHSNMVLVEVNFPSGYVVDDNPITDATAANPIKKFEIRFGATSVVVYYDNMGTELNCFSITAYRRLIVALSRPAHVLVHDFYRKDLFALKVYNVQQQNVCDICEQHCPASCTG